MGELITADNFRENLPSMETMGFIEKLKRSFPYHPAIPLMLVHYEESWKYYQWWAVDKRIPDFDEIEKRWWRTKFRSWYRIHVRKSSETVEGEEKFFIKYPDLRHSWELYRAKVILLESKKYGFAVSKRDFHYYLQRKWLILKKYEYMIRELGLKEEPIRQYRRDMVIKRYQTTLIWCTHWNCWQKRIWYIPLNLYYFTKWHYHYKAHKEYLDI